MKHFDTILPFPSDVDREAFGHWLSGFVDGEGTFTLQLSERGYYARFAISLRRDDRPILEQIQSYWQCGQIRDRPNYGNGAGHPLTIFEVAKMSSLWHILVPHFKRFPLRAKKRHDFAIWEQAVQLWSVTSKRRIIVRGHHEGTFPRWTEEEKERFVSLHTLLRQQRGYETPPPSLTSNPIMKPSEPTLFD